MAENTSTTTHHHHHRRESKPAAKKRGRARKRKPAARRTDRPRSTTATTPSKSTGRRVRTQARNETREAAKANARAARTTAEQGKSIAERAALSYVGATLEARDRVIETAASLADTFGTRKKAERELKKLQSRYERRGVKARNQLERDVKKARTRLERVVRRNRNAVERDAARRDNVVTEQLSGVSNRVEEAVQVGVAAAQRVGTHRQGPHRRAGVAPDLPPRAAGEAAPRVSLPASYPAGGTRRPHISRRVQHSLLPQPSPCPSGCGVGL